ncbi:MAG: signal peptidase II [Patescibacteria group bacterium]
MRLDRHGIFLWISGFLFFSDRILKFLAPRFPENALSTSSHLAGAGFFLNPKLLGLTLPSFFSFGAALAALVLFLIFAAEQKLSRPPVYLILAGGLSNLVDRGLFSGVVDFIRIGNATFNIADLLIWVGIFLLLRQAFFSERPSPGIIS